MSKPEIPDYENFVSWIKTSLKNNEIPTLNQADLELQILNGDAGFRRYFRINSSLPMLAVYAPPASENSTAFLQIAEYLRKLGVRAPAVINFDVKHGFLLVEDLGENLFLDTVNEINADTMYSQALMLLLRIQQGAIDYSIFPVYSREKLRDEMNLFPEWFVGKMLGLELSEQEQKIIDETFTLLEKSAVSQPQVIVHRDFHSRNLINSEDGNFGVVDFQDAVAGPITYDLVSLLKDCYVQWPQEQVNRWLKAYANMAIEVGVIPSVSQDEFMRWFDWIGLQRHIKVLGIFCRLSLRDGKQAYLNNLPLVLHYVRQILENYSEFTDFRVWFERSLMPIINKQDWMQQKV